MAKRRDFIVRFAGEGGQGMVTAAEALAQTAAQAGYHALTFATFPSQIIGGPTWAQTRISTAPVHSPGDELDVLVAFNREAYEEHRGEVRHGGVIIYDSGAFQLEGGDHVQPLPFEELGKSTGNARASNMVVLGTLSYLVAWPEKYLTDFITNRFSRGRPGDEEVVRSNIQAGGLGRQEAAKWGFALGELAPPSPRQGQQVFVKGNEAVALGAMAADIDVYVGYPISPATPILVFMERNLVGPGKLAYQASSEIEAINAAIGAGYAGKKAMTATSGPGLSLMSEGIGLSWMSEIPLVVVDVQRGGPATGLPTKTEQSDLLAALNIAHGDVRMPIIAPGTVEECFYAAAHAFKWAERYQGPVVVLSEMVLAERAQNIPKPDLGSVVLEKRVVYRGADGYLRYEEPGLSPMPVPGGPGAYVANGSEHDPMGDTTHRSNWHQHMTERRFRKLKLLEDGTYESLNPDEPVVLMPWGGTKGPAQEAYKLLLEQGTKLGWNYTMFLNPLPPRLLDELRHKELVIVPELNYLGQFSSVLRSLGVRAESITQYTGLPFKVRELADRIAARLQAGVKERVTV
ncbi:MAG: 2-oxoacid:acceptor oxidoreductase subunit alpha [Chloroflexi bacterium]|nr:2-oxoacid:acceptor oxidoreductase subunit alpha [Chloroflexota bacterium]